MAGPDLSRPGRTQLSVYLTDQVADELHHVAAAMRISRSELARRILEDFLAGQPTPTGAS